MFTNNEVEVKKSNLKNGKKSCFIDDDEEFGREQSAERENNSVNVGKPVGSACLDELGNGDNGHNKRKNKKKWVQFPLSGIAMSYVNSRQTSTSLGQRNRVHLGCASDNLFNAWKGKKGSDLFGKREMNNVQEDEARPLLKQSNSVDPAKQKEEEEMLEKALQESLLTAQKEAERRSLLIEIGNLSEDERLFEESDSKSSRSAPKCVESSKQSAQNSKSDNDVNSCDSLIKRTTFTSYPVQHDTQLLNRPKVKRFSSEKNVSFQFAIDPCRTDKTFEDSQKCAQPKVNGYRHFNQKNGCKNRNPKKRVVVDKQPMKHAPNNENITIMNRPLGNVGNRLNKASTVTSCPTLKEKDSSTLESESNASCMKETIVNSPPKVNGSPLNCNAKEFFKSKIVVPSNFVSSDNVPKCGRSLSPNELKVKHADEIKVSENNVPSDGEKMQTYLLNVQTPNQMIDSSVWGVFVPPLIAQCASQPTLNLPSSENSINEMKSLVNSSIVDVSNTQDAKTDKPIISCVDAGGDNGIKSHSNAYESEFREIVRTFLKDKENEIIDFLMSQFITEKRSITQSVEPSLTTSSEYNMVQDGCTNNVSSIEQRDPMNLRSEYTEAFDLNSSSLDQISVQHKVFNDNILDRLKRVVKQMIVEYPDLKQLLLDESKSVNFENCEMSENGSQDVYNVPMRQQNTPVMCSSFVPQQAPLMSQSSRSSSTGSDLHFERRVHPVNQAQTTPEHCIPEACLMQQTSPPIELVEPVQHQVQQPQMLYESTSMGMQYVPQVASIAQGQARPLVQQQQFLSMLQHQKRSTEQQTSGTQVLLQQHNIPTIMQQQNSAFHVPAELLKHSHFPFPVMPVAQQNSPPVMLHPDRYMKQSVQMEYPPDFQQPVHTAPSIENIQNDNWSRYQWAVDNDRNIQLHDNDMKSSSGDVNCNMLHKIPENVNSDGQQVKQSTVSESKSIPVAACNMKGMSDGNESQEVQYKNVSNQHRNIVSNSVENVIPNVLHTPEPNYQITSGVEIDRNCPRYANSFVPVNTSQTELYGFNKSPFVLGGQTVNCPPKALQQHFVPFVLPGFHTSPHVYSTRGRGRLDL